MPYIHTLREAPKHIPDFPPGAVTVSAPTFDGVFQVDTPDKKRATIKKLAVTTMAGRLTVISQLDKQPLQVIHHQPSEYALNGYRPVQVFAEPIDALSVTPLETAGGLMLWQASAEGLRVLDTDGLLAFLNIVGASASKYVGK